MTKMKIRVHEGSIATLQDLQYDDNQHTLLAKFGTPGEAKRCISAISEAWFGNGGLDSKYEMVSYFPIHSNVAIFMAGKAGADAVNDFILENFG